MKKTLLKKTVCASAVILALLLVTCIGEPPGEDISGVEFTDVEYSRDGRNVTVYLDGVGVPVTREMRVLNLELAKMAHDFFEVVFVSGGTVARASWGIGQNAGISGVVRGPTYVNVSGDPAAVIIAGKRAGAGKTLLGVGHMIMVDKVAGTTVLQGSKSVTFLIHPLTTQLGWEDADTNPVTPETLIGGDSGATFRTAAKAPTSDDPDDVTDLTTLGRTVTVRGTIAFPFFQLPPPPSGNDEVRIATTYRIGGLEELTAVQLPPYGRPDLAAALRVSAALDVDKKIASFIDAGQIFDASSSYDLGTYIKSKATDIIGNKTAGNVFVPEFSVVWTQKSNSSGVFGWTFQVPVYALSSVSPADNGGPGPETWYIRPGFGEYQYLLDNGKDAGGAVLMGSDMGDSDWLQIFTEGFGFNN
jgi:hypothetical protein